ncbi:MAG: hypothetical protein ACK559_35005, partial [bacterium]
MHREQPAAVGRRGHPAIGRPERLAERRQREGVALREGGRNDCELRTLRTGADREQPRGAGPLDRSRRDVLQHVRRGQRQGAQRRQAVPLQVQ